MGSDNHVVQVDTKPMQAPLILERLKALRGELGMLGEELINLLRNAGVATHAESGSVTKKNSEWLI